MLYANSIIPNWEISKISKIIRKLRLPRVGMCAGAATLSAVPVSAAEVGVNIGINELTTGLVALGSALFGLAMLWGAAKIMAAGGDEKLMEEGKNVVKNAVIGYVILVIASTIPRLAGHIEVHPLVLIPVHP